MIPDNITLEDCAERNVYWEGITTSYMMSYWRDLSVEITEVDSKRWKEASQNARTYWLFGLDTWGREFSFAVYDEQQKRR